MAYGILCSQEYTLSAVNGCQWLITFALKMCGFVALFIAFAAVAAAVVAFVGLLHLTWR